MFPLWNLITETRIGSDHIPLVLSSGEDRLRRSPRFFFETTWFEVEGFNQMFLDKWDAALAGVGSQHAPLDMWVAAAASCVAARLGSQPGARRQAAQG